MVNHFVDVAYVVMDFNFWGVSMGVPFHEIPAIFFSFPVSSTGKYFKKTLKEAAIFPVHGQTFKPFPRHARPPSRFHMHFYLQSRITLTEKDRSRVTLRPH